MTPNARLKLAAALLALFLGFLGAHWYYLGVRRKGHEYLATFATGWLLLVILIGGPILVVQGLVCLYDGLKFLAMDPEEFDRRYNGRHS